MVTPPLLVQFVTKSRLEGAAQNVPRGFARRNFPIGSSDWMIMDEGGAFWPVRIHFDGKRSEMLSREFN